MINTSDLQRQVSNTASNLLGSASAAASNAGSFLGPDGILNKGVNAAKGLLEKIQDPSKLMQSLRLATGGVPVDAINDVINVITAAKFPAGVEQDWRVKLSLPSTEPFSSDSKILYPLHATGGLVFPFTPAVLISHSASYNALQPTHSNYPFQVYANSQVDQLVITGDFFVQNGHEAQYWVAALHYLRSITKMYYGGEGEQLGAPPPIVYLDGYGDYVFNRVPVVVTTFTIDMPDSVDYICTEIVTDSDAKKADKKHRPWGGAGPESYSNHFYQQGSTKASLHGWAPTQSLFSVTCQPIYSRRALEGFSLEKFVKGEYISNKGGGFI